MTDFADNTARHTGKSARKFIAGLAKHRSRVAIEVGDTAAHLLRIRREVSGLTIEKAITVDLAKDGLLTPEELSRRLTQILAEFPDAPVAFSLPVGRSHSQIINLAQNDTAAAQEFVQTIAGNQFDQVQSIFDIRPLRAYGTHANPSWITIARESDVQLQLQRCAVESTQVTNVASADAALAAAFNEMSGGPASAVLIEIGAISTALVLISDGQIVFSASIDTGTGAIFSALANDLNYSAEGAETLIRKKGAKAVNTATPQLETALLHWQKSIETLLREHAREAGVSFEQLLTVPRRLSGTLLGDAGVRDIFEKFGGGNSPQCWPEVLAGDGGQMIPLAPYAIAFGTAVLACGLQPSFAELLPQDARDWRTFRHRSAWLHAACLAVIAIGFIFTAHTAIDTYHSIKEKKARLEMLTKAHEVAPLVKQKLDDLNQIEIEATPVLYFQKRTRDFLTGLRTLADIRATAKDADFWFVYAADNETYNARAIPPTGAIFETQLLRNIIARPTGLVTELSIPPTTKDHLGTISGIVQKLRAGGHFPSVDILPMSARQPMADAAVLAPNGGAFGITLDTATFDNNLPPPQRRGGGARNDTAAATPAPAAAPEPAK